MQAAVNGQAIETFGSYFCDGGTESSVVQGGPKPRGTGLRPSRAWALAPSWTAGYNSRMPPASQAIRVKVLFFGRLKELVGHAEDSIERAEATTIEQLFALYAARHPELAKYRSSVVASRNQEFAAWDTPLRAGDEVAFLPPVSGG